MPPLTTELFNVGLKVPYNPPVGFAKDPADTFNSEGNEIFFSYDGTWKHGKLHGHGKYLYLDGGTYIGQFENNWPHGDGVAEYPTNHTYDGISFYNTE
jgi:hypothetical protein